MNTFHYQPRVGECITDIVEKMIKTAWELEKEKKPCEIIATLNGAMLKIVATEDKCTTFEEAMSMLQEGWDKEAAEHAARRAIEDAKPENIELRRKEEERRAAQRAELEAEGTALCAFTFASAEAEEIWKHLVDVNNADKVNEGFEDYGACTVRYAARWAHKMEARIAAGEKLEDVAKASSHDADLEGITGFMYGWAVTQLSRVWVHGKALRRWHNLDTQIGNEGEKANKSGGTLNPALLTLTPKS